MPLNLVILPDEHGSPNVCDINSLVQAWIDGKDIEEIIDHAGIDSALSMGPPKKEEMDRMLMSVARDNAGGDYWEKSE